MRYTVTTEIKSQTRIFKFIYLQDFLFLVVYVALIYMSMSLVSSALKVPYVIFTIVAAIFLISPSSANKERRVWQSILISLRKQKTPYHADYNISYSERENDAEKD